MKSKRIGIVIVTCLIVIFGVYCVFKINEYKSTESTDDTAETTVEQTEADAYYEENASKIISSMSITESENMLSEAEVIQLLEDRGFTSYTITTSYSEDGEYYDDEEISSDSSAIHPMYQGYVMTDNDDVWFIVIIDGDLMVYSLTYTTNDDVPIIISEHEYVTSYYDNTFYRTIPEADVIVVETVELITIHLLNELE